MMKRYTDYLALVFGSGDRIYHMEHFRNDKTDTLNMSVKEINNHTYRMVLDRAYRINWATWSKVIANDMGRWEEPWYFKREDGKVARKTVSRERPPRMPINVHKTMNEVIRSKKIGLMLFQEPPPPRQVIKVTECVCSCGFKGESMKGTRIHVKSKGEGHELIETQEIELVGVKEPIDPFHYSKTELPSGKVTE